MFSLCSLWFAFDKTKIKERGVVKIKNNQENNEQKKKKPYVKPEVKQVPLKPEEAVLGSCKLSTFTGPGGSNCGIPVDPCSAVGS